MEEEAGGGDAMAMEEFPEWSPSADTVNGDGDVSFGGEIELGDKDGFLISGIVADDGVIEADFADGGFGVGVESMGEAIEPSGGAGITEPRVEAKGGGDPRVLLGERGDGRPVIFLSAVDHCVGEAFGVEFLDDLWEVRFEAGVLEMIMGVDHGSW